MKSNEEIRIKFWGRLCIWIALLILGMMTVADGVSCIFPYLYPSGFGYALLGNRGGVIGGCLSYAIYIGILAGFLLSTKLRTFRTLCVIMILVCTITSYGCKKMMHGGGERNSTYEIP